MIRHAEQSSEAVPGPGTPGFRSWMNVPNPMVVDCMVDWGMDRLVFDTERALTARRSSRSWSGPSGERR